MIEGPRSFLSAADCGYAVHTIIRSRVLVRNRETRQRLATLHDAGSQVVNVSPEVFRTICRMPRASGIAAIVGQPDTTIRSAHVSSGLFLAITRIRTPGNLGTLIRSAAAVGCDGIFVLGDQVDAYAPLVVRASMGEFFRVPLIRTCWQALRQWTVNIGAHLVAADPAAQSSHFDIQWHKPTVLMLGDERTGLSSRQRQHAKQLIRIPMSRSCDSLNLGVAGSLIMYEFLRATRPVVE